MMRRFGLAYSWNRIHSVAGASLLTVALASGLMIGTDISANAQSASAQNAPAGSAKKTESAPAPIDQVIGWLEEARHNYTGVRDYTCTLLKRERVNGTLQENNIIMLQFKAKPFSVHMKWLAPRRFSGQEVCYVHGQNGNQLRVKQKGLLKGKVVGFVSVAPDDRRLMRHTSHTIYEAGIGALIEQSYQNLQKDKSLNHKVLVNSAEYTFDKRKCIRVETVQTQNHPGCYCYRTVMFLEKASKFPLRCENYDWPRQGGDANGDLIESCSYVDIRFNVGLPDSNFDK